MTHSKHLRGLSDQEFAKFLSYQLKIPFMDVLRWLQGEFEGHEIVPPTATYPFNLIYDIIGKDFCAVLTQDHIDGFNYIVSETLTVREQKIIVMRYKDHMTYDQIGKEFEISGSRVNQIVNKSIRKLRNPGRSRYFTYGLNECKQRQKKSEVIRNRERAEFVASIKSHLHELRIDELDLSVRSYNGLIRARVETLSDLFALTEDEICQISGIGRVSAREIIWKRKDFLKSIEGD